MISSGKRVVAFIDKGANTTGDTVDFLIPEFPNIWETPFDYTDSSFPCSIDRTSGPLPNNQHMFMINHFLDIGPLGVLIPDKHAATKTNTVDSILANAAGCAHLAGGRAPNFILLDWVDEGHGIQAGNRLNGL